MVFVVVVVGNDCVKELENGQLVVGQDLGKQGALDGATAAIARDSLNSGCIKAIKEGRR